MPDFFRKRLTLAVARECQGTRSEVIAALPPPERSRTVDVAADSAFSVTIRPYSAGEQSFCMIRRERRVIVPKTRVSGRSSSLQEAILGGAFESSRGLLVITAIKRFADRGGFISLHRNPYVRRSSPGTTRRWFLAL